MKIIGFCENTYIVICLGLVPSQLAMVGLVEAGAAGFIMKEASVKDFCETIRTVARGENVLPPPLTGSLFSQVVSFALKKGTKQFYVSNRMTCREREIRALIAEGLRNKEIAQRLHIKPHTVKSHVHNILEKLALHSRLQIATQTYDEAGT